MTTDANTSELTRSAAPGKTTRRWLQILFAAFMLATVTFAEDRKVKSSPPPEYPELAKRMNIRGVARVRITVAPDGTVKDVKELGGNPVLVDALTRAVKKWKYEPGEGTSLIEVKYDFNPQ